MISSISRLLLTIVLVATGIDSSPAATVSLSQSDAADQASFDSGQNWSGGAAPTSANDYVVDGGRELRTPASDDNFTFGGNSLSLSGGGILEFRAGKSAIFSFPGKGLSVDGGIARNSSPGNRPVGVGGNFVAGSKGAILELNRGGIEFRAPVEIVGHLETRNGPETTLKFNHTVQFGAEAKVSVIQTVCLIQLPASTIRFDLGSPGRVCFEGPGRSLWKGTFVFSTTSEAAAGSRWHIVNTAEKTFEKTFKVEGFAKSGTIWTSTDGHYQFDEQSGVLAYFSEAQAVQAEAPARATADAPSQEKSEPVRNGETPKPESGSQSEKKPLPQPEPKVDPKAEHPSVETPSQTQMTAKPGRSSGYFWLVIGVALLTVVGLGVLIFMLYRSIKN